MKSKAHMKKCLELGVSMSSVEDTEADEAGRELGRQHGFYHQIMLKAFKVFQQQFKASVLFPPLSRNSNKYCARLGRAQEFKPHH